MRRSSDSQNTKFVPLYVNDATLNPIYNETRNGSTVSNEIRSAGRIVQLLVNASAKEKKSILQPDVVAGNRALEIKPDKMCSINKELAVLHNPLSSDDISQEENVNLLLPEKRMYNVVWAKLSTKKHKTWEDDGILEVDGKNLVLKSMEGVILGQSNNVKLSTLEEGSHLKVGSKEVEIQELIQCKRTANLPESLPGIKKSRLT